MTIPADFSRRLAFWFLAPFWQIGEREKALSIPRPIIIDQLAIAGNEHFKGNLDNRFFFQNNIKYLSKF